MDERGLSLRGLAGRAGVDPSHLSRVLRAKGKVPSADLAAAVAVALGLDRDYFVEYREQRVIAAIRSDPRLRESVYRRLQK
jgi:transcriptional regulator with XRE-family HTH domain